MKFTYRVIQAAGKDSETLQLELNNAGNEGFRVVAVTGASDRRAEMLVMERAIQPVDATRGVPVAG